MEQTTLKSWDELYRCADLDDRGTVALVDALENRAAMLEGTLRKIAEDIDPRSREWLMSDPPQHAPCYAARRIARETLALIDNKPSKEERK